MSFFKKFKTELKENFLTDFKENFLEFMPFCILGGLLGSAFGSLGIILSAPLAVVLNRLILTIKNNKEE